MEETAPSPVQEPSPPPSGIVLPPSQVVGSSNNSTSPPSISPIPVLEELIPPISAPSPFLPSIPPRPPPPSRPRPPSPSHRVAPPIVPPVTCVPSPSPGQEYVNSDDVVAPVEPPQTASPSPSPSWQLYPMPKTPVVDQKPPLFSLPSFPQSNYNKPSSSSVGMIVGISAGVAGVFFILGFILLYFYHRKERTKTIAFEDCESFPRENFYAVEHKPCHKKIPVVPAHVIPATARPFSPNYNSNDDNSPSAHSGSHNPLSPQARVAAFGFSCANFTYEELAMATNDFSSDNLLGEGGFGYVHKGMLSSGRLIAVKQLKEGSQQGEREFQAEVETISRVHHKHLVCLVGYCMSGAKRLLVYEFVPNGTLEFHLHGKGQPVMQWKTRMGIAIGAAKGLAYLHEDCDPTIIHRDIKATNILVDSKFEAKVSDFGLAKIFSDSDHDVTHVSTRVVGTFGYLAPEYALNGKASHKSDVYSFGVMLLELITGKHPIMTAETSMTLVTWAWPLLLQAQEDQNYALLVDPQLQGNYDGEELARMIACAAACVRHSSWLRPRMSLIVRVLEGDTSVCDLSNGSRPGQSSIPSVLNYDFWGVWHGYVSEDIC